MLRTAIAFLVLLLLPASAHADKRVALVIGKGDYSKVGKLPNPIRDASAIETLLRAAGFDVVELRVDLSRDAMRRSLRDFFDQVLSADIAVANQNAECRRLAPARQGARSAH